MKKETLLSIILGTIGGLIFSVGMCMCLVTEWKMFTPGVIVAIIGFIILLCIIPVYRKNHPKKERGPINWGLVITWTVGVIGSLILGVGMSLIMVGEATKTDMIVGLTTGVVGLLVCVLNYPVYAYIKTNKYRKK